MPSDGETYVGTELELFAHARHWKSYFARSLSPWVRGRVLEVGAGLGSNTRFLQGPAVTSWHCLEPDPALAARLRAEVADLRLCHVSVGTIASLASERFDTLLYLDVLEHIEDDLAETARAAALLDPGGHLIVLAPAHQALYSEFDRAIGHHRRYDSRSLRACQPAGMRLESLFFLDSVGMLASLGNRLMLKREQPRASQIAFWDRYMVPLSVVLDRVSGQRLGRSIIAVWTRT